MEADPRQGIRMPLSAETYQHFHSLTYYLNVCFVVPIS